LPTVWLSPGAQATEQHLLAELDSLLPAGPGLLDALSRPVLVVVPSTALLLHLSAVIGRHRPMIGVRVLTLGMLATEILAMQGEIPRRGAAMAGVLTRRFCAEEPVLAAELGHLTDGYGGVLESVRDILDAGFEPIHLDAVDEMLASASSEEAQIAAALGLPPPEADAQGAAEQRAAAILRVAAQVYESMEVLKVGERSWIYRQAADLLPRNPPDVRALRLVGFCEATGVMGDFIEALLRLPEIELVVDLPPDPAAPWRLDAGAVFTEPLTSRLELITQPRPLPLTSPTPRRETFSAPGGQAELREVARRIRGLLDAGAAPESIAVIPREVEPYRAIIWSELGRAGIPFSALGALGSDSAEARRVGALLDVLCEGEGVRVDRWLEAAGWICELPGPDQLGHTRLRRADLGLALAASGVTRLADVPWASIAGERTEDGFSLPVRGGLVPIQEAAGVHVKAIRRILPHGLLDLARRRAASLLTFFEEWPESAALQVHVRLLRQLLIDELCWDDEPVAVQAIHDALAELLRVHESTLQITLGEFRILCLSALRPVGRAPLGGRGAGVQILSATEARGLTFQTLFLVGLNRDVFPRRIREDALLPDRMRRRLHVLLPALPLRGVTMSGERYLFAWLHTAAPHIVLSWQRMDEDGQTLSASPLVERLRWSAGQLPDEAPTRYSLQARSGVELAFDAAIRAGLHGSRERFRALLPAAMAEGRHRSPDDPEIQAAAAARLRVLDALEPDLREPEGRDAARLLDPYSGIIGPPISPVDPRGNALYVTTLEATARCPWQSFLTHLLRLEPAPDPVNTLPMIEKWMLGDLVHRVLEGVVRDALGVDESDLRKNLDIALERGAVGVGWPGEDAVEQTLLSVARSQIRELGMNLPGMALVLRDMAWPFLLTARALDWPEPDSTLEVLGVEIEGVVPAAGRAIHFKADRADLNGDRLVLTDYKTGRTIDAGKRAATRLRNFLKQVRSGKRLQASTYALAGLPVALARTGRFLFLDPETEDHARDFSVEDDDRDFISAAGSAWSVVSEAWDSGVFVPRIVEPDGHSQGDACDRCDMRQACRLGDSGYRRRLVDHIQRHTPAFKHTPGQLGGVSQTLLRLWWLGQDPPDYADEPTDER
jgi:hypothetical protein